MFFLPLSHFWLPSSRFKSTVERPSPNQLQLRSRIGVPNRSIQLTRGGQIAASTFRQQLISHLAWASIASISTVNAALIGAFHTLPAFDWSWCCAHFSCSFRSDSGSSAYCVCRAVMARSWEVTRKLVVCEAVEDSAWLVEGWLGRSGRGWLILLSYCMFVAWWVLGRPESSHFCNISYCSVRWGFLSRFFFVFSPSSPLLHLLSFVFFLPWTSLLQCSIAFGEVRWEHLLGHAGKVKAVD